MLLVESDESLRESLAKTFRSQGHSVETMGEVGAAANKMRSVNYDVVVTNKDGCRLVELAERCNMGEHRTRIILTSGMREPLLKEFSSMNGFNSYIKTPIKYGAVSL